MLSSSAEGEGSDIGVGSENGRNRIEAQGICRKSDKPWARIGRESLRSNAETCSNHTSKLDGEASLSLGICLDPSPIRIDEICMVAGSVEGIPKRLYRRAALA